MQKLIFLLIIFLLTLSAVQSQRIQPTTVNMTDISDVERLRPPVTGVIYNKNAEENEDEGPIAILPAPNGARTTSQSRPTVVMPGGEESNDLLHRTNLTSVLQNFQGINDDTYIDLVSGSTFRTIPPDVMGAVGVSHVMTVHNNKYRITDKTGTQLTYVDAQAFWNGAAGYGTTGNLAKGHSDPHVLYNHYQNRWLLIAQSNLDGGSALMVAVSSTNDPTAMWTRYIIDVEAANVNGFDYPLLGYNQNWLVVTGNLFPIAGGSAIKNQIYIFSIANLVAGGGLVFTGGGENAQLIESLQSTQSGWSAPCTVFESGAPTNPMYLLQPFWTSGGNTAIRLTSLTGTIPSVAWNTGAAVFVTSGISNYDLNASINNVNSNYSPQAVDSRKLSTNDGRLGNSVMVNGNLWTTQHIFLPAGGTTVRSAAQWWQLSTAGTVLQNGRIDDPSGFLNRSFPSIAVNSAEDVLVGYTLTSGNSFAGSAYSIRRACTPLNKMEYEVVYKQGLDWYYKDFSQGTGRDRWGDYSASSVDPVNGHLWTVQEYASARAGAGDNNSRWGSWWAEIQPETNNSINWETGSTQTIPETGIIVACPSYRDVTIKIKAQCAASGAATVTILSAGSTAGTNDFSLLTPSVVFANGEQSKDVIVRVFDDGVAEANETIVLSYSISGAGVTAGSDAQTQSTTVTISDNDATPVATGNMITASLGVNSYSGGFNQPFRANSLSDAKTQFIYTAAELQAAGLGAGNITSITLPVVTKPTSGTGVYSNFTISMKNTASTSFAAITFETGTTTVYTANLTTVQGDNTIVLTTHFNWDGVSSLLVDICYDNAAILTNSDFIKASITTPVMCVWNRASSGTGCTLTAAFNNTGGSFIRPDIKLLGAKKINPIETFIITVNQWLGPNATINIYNGSNVMATIKNNTSFDYGCTQIIIDRAGTGTTAFWNNVTANRLLDKTFRVIPTNVHPTGSYDITLYYTVTEVTNWQTATGNTWLGNAKIIKIKEPNQISSITPSSPPAQTANIEVNLPSAPALFGTNHSITATFNSGFSGFGVGNAGTSTLPVSMLSFEGRKNNNVVDLNWKVAYENNNNRFEIETGKQVNNFYKIGYVSSYGNSSITQSYAYTDILPVKGVNYYRLKQVDNDGIFSYSRTIAVMFDEKGKLIILFPNPAKDKLTINFSQPQQNISLRIISSDGKEIMKEVVANIQRTYDVAVSKLIPGSYLVEVRIGKEKTVLQFIKE